MLYIFIVGTAIHSQRLTDCCIGGSQRWPRGDRCCKATWSAKINGCVTHGTKPGPNPYLTKAEETELSKILAVTSKAGYGKTRSEVKLIAETLKYKASKQDVQILKGDQISDGCLIGSITAMINCLYKKARMDSLKECVGREQAHEFSRANL